MRSEDGNIIQKCLDGESEAFGFIVDKYKESVYAFAYTKLRNFHDAEDVTQEVFLKAYRKLNMLKSYDSLPAWLYAITSNTCKSWIRDKSMRPDQDFIDDSGPDMLESNSMESYRESLIMDLLHDALDTLPEIYRQVVIMHYLGDMNSFEIAEFTGIAPGSVRQRLTRAREMLKKEMLVMMNATFEGQRLKAGFTFRIVEAIKNIRVNPISTIKGLPWGLSFATGIMFVIMSINPHISQMIMPNILAGSPLLSESRVLKMGEIPIDILETDKFTFIGSGQHQYTKNQNMANDNNAYYLAPQAGNGEWSKGANMPTPRMYVSTSVVDGKIYAMGGSSNFVSIPAVEEYDLQSNTWQKKNKMPIAKDGFSTCVLDEKIYVIGGAPFNAPSLSMVEVYDPKKDEWTEKASMNNKRWINSSCVINDKIYVFGGSNFWGMGQAISAVEEYEPESDKWTEIGKMPNPRGGMGIATVNGKAYLIGGGETREGPYYNHVDEFDPVTNTWTEKADMPTARAGLAIVVIDNKIYAIGGANNFWGPYLSIVEMYDPETDTWSKADEFSSMPTKRCLFDAEVIDGKAYAVGGAINAMGAVATLEIFDPEAIIQQSIDPNGKKKVTWGNRKIF